MNAVGIEPVVTPENLLAMADGRNFELIDGELRERNASPLSSWIGGQVFGWLRDFVQDNKLGTVWPAGNGYQCFPDVPGRVRRPNAAFIRRERFTMNDTHDGYLKVVPDLVVEVISLNDLAHDVERKVSEYLDAGVRLVWVIDPETRTMRVQRSDGTGAFLRGDAVISGEAVLPGFELPLPSIFPRVAPPSQAVETRRSET